MTAPVLAIVDDYQPFLDYLAMFLRARGYEVRPYLSGRDIVAAAIRKAWFPTDAKVHDALRRLMGPQGERRE